MLRFLYRRSAGTGASVGLLVLRLVMGAAFILHGWGKIQSPLSWMPAEAPVPGFLQLLAAVAEFGGHPAERALDLAPAVQDEGGSHDEAQGEQAEGGGGSGGAAVEQAGHGNRGRGRGVNTLHLYYVVAGKFAESGGETAFGHRGRKSPTVFD
jgi:hypothetical protein